MRAKRIAGFSEIDTECACYWEAERDGKPVWRLYLPRCGVGDLSDHDVIEHEDGTITVSPSILMSGHDNGTPSDVHGFLERGVWRDA